MNLSVAQIVYSKFFNPAFNSAIYDDCFRIYFAQMHENHALEFYFLFKEKRSELFERIKEICLQQNKQLYILLYPTEEYFNQVFEDDPLFEYGVGISPLEKDVIIGVHPFHQDSSYDKIINIIETWSLNFYM